MRLALVLLLGVGCGATGDDTLDVTFDPCAVAVATAGDASGAEVMSVEAGMQLWNAAAGLGLRRPEEAPELPQVLVLFDDAPAAFKGVYDDERGIVFINRALSQSHHGAVTVAHELGHAFALPHVEMAERTCLMNPANSTVEPTESDVTALRARWGNCAVR